MIDRTVTAEKEREKVRENSVAEDSTEVVVDKIVIRSVAFFTGLIGLWAFACLGSAMYQAGGPFKLVSSWFRAVTGM